MTHVRPLWGRGDRRPQTAAQELWGTGQRMLALARTIERLPAADGLLPPGDLPATYRDLLRDPSLQMADILAPLLGAQPSSPAQVEEPHRAATVLFGPPHSATDRGSAVVPRPAAPDKESPRLGGEAANRGSGPPYEDAADLLRDAAPFAVADPASTGAQPAQPETDMLPALLPAWRALAALAGPGLAGPARPWSAAPDQAGAAVPLTKSLLRTPAPAASQFDPWPGPAGPAGADALTDEAGKSGETDEPADGLRLEGRDDRANPVRDRRPGQTLPGGDAGPSQVPGQKGSPPASGLQPSGQTRLVQDTHGLAGLLGAHLAPAERPGADGRLLTDGWSVHDGQKSVPYQTEPDGEPDGETAPDVERRAAGGPAEIDMLELADRLADLLEFELLRTYGRSRLAE